MWHASDVTGLPSTLRPSCRRRLRRSGWAEHVAEALDAVQDDLPVEAHAPHAGRERPVGGPRLIDVGRPLKREANQAARPQPVVGEDLVAVVDEDA